MIVPSWIRQTAVLIAIYVAAMFVLTLWMPVWHDWDWRFFQWVSSTQTPTLSPTVSLVDVRSWDVENVPLDRRTVARFLEHLAKSGQHPRAVVLDIAFGNCHSAPCSDPSWNSATAALENALEEVARAKIDVYAAEALEPGQVGHDDPSAIEPHDQDIYARLAGTAHTHFTPVPGSAGLFYRVCYRVPRTDRHGLLVSGDTLAAWAMVWRVMPDFDPTQPCDTEHLPVFVGAIVAPLDASGYANLTSPNYSITSQTAFPSGGDMFNGKYVVLGTVARDRPKDSDRSGVELVAWALSDVLRGEGPRNPLRAEYKARPQNEMLLLLVPAFSGLVALACTAWYLLLRRLQLRGTRRFLPWIAAILAVGMGFAAFAGFETWMYVSEASIQPQVTLVSFGMILSGLLCGVRGNQIEFAQLYALDDGAPVEKYDYDVFISYAHEEGAWVYEHVYSRFCNAKLPDGQKLSIFFDTTEIRGGTAWQTKISLAINASRFIVPVYSDVYFRRPYCRFEINRAHRKWINAGEGSRCVLPVMRGHTKIPEAVDDFEAISVDEQPDIVEQYILEIVTRLTQVTPTAG